MQHKTRFDSDDHSLDTPAAEWGRFGARLGLFALLWLGLNGLDVASWTLGAPAVAVSAWVSYRLRPPRPWRLSPLAAIRFAGFFLLASLRGGMDVARRALHPRCSVRPGELEFQPLLPDGPARLFFTACISLVPGTLVLDLEDGRIRVHALEISSKVEADLRELEEQVAALFGMAIAPPEAGR